MERERMAVHATSTNILLGCTFSQMKEMAQEKGSFDHISQSLRLWKKEW